MTFPRNGLATSERRHPGATHKTMITIHCRDSAPPVIVTQTDLPSTWELDYPGSTGLPHRNGASDNQRPGVQVARLLMPSNVEEDPSGFTWIYNTANRKNFQST